MSSMSPGARTVSKESAEVKARPLEDATLRQRLSTLRSLLASSIGPRARLHVLHNDSGGHVTATSTASRILKALAVSDPVLRLITTALEGHLRMFSDCGHVAALLSLSLIEGGLDLELQRRLIVDVHELILEVCVGYLSAADCVCSAPVHLSCPHDVAKVIRCQLTSKPGCFLFGEDLKHAVGIVRDAFIETFGFSGSQGRDLIRVVGVEGHPVVHSFLVRGLLLESPQIPTYRRTPLEVPVKPEQGRGARVGADISTVAVALVKVSMAGDSDDLPDVSYEVTETGFSNSSSSTTVEGAMLVEMLNFVDRLASEGHIGVLACQKVVHPKVKVTLRRRGVLVLDRLGADFFTALADLAGGVPIASFRTQIRAVSLGEIRMPLHEVHHGKSYVLLQRAQRSRGVPVCTLVLCHRSEEALEEFKETCRRALHVLATCARDGRMLVGGGCWLTCLASHLQARGRHCLDNWAEDIGCRPSHVRLVLDNFCRVLELVTLALDTSHNEHLTESQSSHHFALPQGLETKPGEVLCQCGAVHLGNTDDVIFRYLGRERPQLPSRSELGEAVALAKCDVMDSYSASVNALQTAVGVANLVLSIANSVTDVN